MIQRLQGILQEGAKVSLADLSKFEPSARVDTKFVFEIALLPQLLSQLITYSKVLHVDELSVFSYFNTYYDTLGFDSYFEHHNGVGNRTKYRIRKYGVGLHEIGEVKEKSNKGVTSKKRSSQTTDSALDFVFSQNKYLSPLQEKVDVNYNRITLLDPGSKEKMTIDFNLNCSYGTSSFEFKNMVIAELKQTKFKRNTCFFQSFKKHHIYPTSFSKYCMSLAFLKQEIKQNRFRQNIKNTLKIINQ